MYASARALDVDSSKREFSYVMILNAEQTFIF